MSRPVHPTINSSIAIMQSGNTNSYFNLEQSLSLQHINVMCKQILLSKLGVALGISRKGLTLTVGL